MHDTPRLTRLAILRAPHPRAFIFRGSERTFHPADAWEERFSVLQGIEGKSVDEEIERLANVPFFTRLKREHPEQLVLLHFNGNARDPRWRREAYFAGHWLYFEGATITADLPADEGVAEIPVSDASRFHTGIGREGRHTDDIGVCALDDDGRPNWFESEQAELVDVDEARNVITVRRARFHTRPRTWTAGRAYAAAHVSEGPWGRGSGNMMWYYNFSTLCPRDGQGRTCSDVLAGEIGELFGSGGELEAFDGLEFDVSKASLINHSYTREWFGREIDADGDGKGDYGLCDGVETYGVGTREFYRQVRERLGSDRLVMADGFRESHQRGFGILNGIESEGWPRGDDSSIDDWSGGVNRHRFWKRFGAEPTLSYSKHAYWGLEGPDLPFNVTRLVFAGMVLTDSAVALATLPEAEPGATGLPIWDELVGGAIGRLGWLGKVAGEPVRWARSGTPAFSQTLSGEALARRIVGATVEPRVEAGGDRTAVEIVRPGAPGPGPGDPLRFEIPGLQVEGPDLSLFLTASCSPMTGYPDDYARLFTVRVRTARWTSEPRMTWLCAEPFDAGFYFSSPEIDEANEVTLMFEAEGGSPVAIDELEAYAAPDAMWQAFENGLVLANPAPHPVEIDPQTLTPGVRYRRLAGSAHQDPGVNDGNPVDGPVTIGAKDGLFLVAERLQR